VSSVVDQQTQPLFVLSGASLQAKLRNRWISPKAHDLIDSASLWANAGNPRVLLHPDRNFKIRTYYGWHLKQIAEICFAVLRGISGAHTQQKIYGFKSRVLFFYWIRALTVHRPGAVFGISLERELILAAMSLQIATIEIQHGDFAGPEVYWQEIHPDFMLVWPSTDLEIFRDSEVSPIVSPFPSAMISEKASDVTTDIECDGLVFLTHSLEESEDPFGAFPKDLFSKALELQELGADLHFRIHPVFSKSKRKSLKRFIVKHFPHSKVRPAAEPISNSLFAAKWCLMSASSAWLEATLHGRVTQITNHEFWNNVSERLRSRTGSLILPPSSDGIEVATPITRGKLAALWAEVANLEDIIEGLLSFISEGKHRDRI
jgi:hypothetical protein